mmetsp:Transcript_140235/g.349564  ORF Transcript_140235/g.349564 Transcript_140235/m.349564 type:complete len:218 (-) Transcript_140235:104-757(-)
MGKYQKKQQIQKTKATTNSKSGAVKQRKSKKSSKAKAASKKAAAAAAAKVAKKAGEGGADVAMDTSIGSAAMETGVAPGGGGSSCGPEATKIVNFLARARTESKATEALKKALSSGLALEALGAALNHCAGRGLAGCVRLLLERGAPMNQPDPSQPLGRSTPLQLAASRGHVNVCRLLVEAGADKTGALEASQELAKLGAVFAEEKKAIQAALGVPR